MIGCDRDVEKMDLIDALHCNKITEQHAAGGEHLRLVTRAQRIDEIAARPRVRIGEVFDGQHGIEVALGQWLELGFDGIEHCAHGLPAAARMMARSWVVWATLSRM